MSGAGETNPHRAERCKGSNLPGLHPQHFTTERARDRESVEGRLFAMMAAQGLDVLWNLLFLSVICLQFAVSGSNNGMYLKYQFQNRLNIGQLTTDVASKVNKWLVFLIACLMHVEREVAGKGAVLTLLH